jgi:hypothetical protein
MILAGLFFILYNSWLLGYYLNPLVAGSALASLLGASGQPYNWLFIWGDVVCGLVVLAISALVYKPNRLLIISLSGFIVFGIMTALSALLPIHCSGVASSCDFTNVFDIHDITGALAGIGQFVGMIYATILAKKLPIYKWDKLFLWVWAFLGVSYLLSAIPAINRLKDITTIAVIWQDAFLVVSGALVVLSAYTYLDFTQQER